MTIKLSRFGETDKLVQVRVFSRPPAMNVEIADERPE
jgi:hypothetical protein